MIIMCLILNLIGLATAITGALTAVDIFPGFLQAGSLISPGLLTAFFWWVISIILLLSGIAFGIYHLGEKRR